jgi:outer membrane protein TolC
LKNEQTTRRSIMKKNHRWALGLFLTVLAAAGWAQDNPRVMSLSLEDAIAKTLKNNLGLAIQVLNPELSSSAVSRAQEKFLPTFSLSYQKQNTDSPSVTYVDSSGNLVQKTDSFTFLQASQAVPFGGTFSLSMTGSKTDQNRTGVTINPSFNTTLRMSLTQPLLRNFGYNISRYSILVARNNLTVSEYQLKQTLADTIYSVENGYWNLVYAIDNLKVRQQSVDLARDLLEKNQRSVEVGTLAPMEILSAQAEVATREADLIQAETQVKSAEDQLKVLINMPENEARAIETIKPLDSPPFEEHKTNLDEALATALQFRPDLEATKVGVEIQRLNLTYAKNQLLPDLNLSASYWSPGVSGTQLFYIGNPILGIPDPDRPPIPGGIGEAFKNTWRFKNNNWSLGLTLNIPMNNIFSRANYVQAKLNLQQQMLTLQNQQQQIFLEIKNAVRSVDANFKRITAYKVARELAEQKLAAEEEKLNVGQSTSYNVLLFQRDLANARISELNAIVAYSLSLASLDRSLGVSLRNRNVKLTDYTQN